MSKDNQLNKLPPKSSEEISGLLIQLLMKPNERERIWNQLVESILKVINTNNKNEIKTFQQSITQLEQRETQLQKQIDQLTAAQTEYERLKQELQLVRRGLKLFSASRQTEYERLKQELQQARTQLAALEQSYQQLQPQPNQHLQAEITRLSRELQQYGERIDQLQQTLSRFINDQPASPPSSHTSAIAPPATVLQSEAASIADQNQLVALLRKRMQRVGLDESVTLALHAAFMSGLMPIVKGSGAMAALEAYAHVIAGGRLASLSIVPTIVQPADLFVVSPADRQACIAHPAGLLDTVLFAQQPEQADTLFLIVLEGINRSTVETYLLPLLQCYATAQQPQAHRYLPLFHPSLLPQDHPYAPAARLVWPKNVLLAGTVVEGIATLPLPAELWSYACLINVDARIDLHTASSSAARHSVTAHQWLTWHAEAMSRFGAALKDCRDLLDSEKDLRIPEMVLAAGARLFACCQTNEAEQLAVSSVFGPYAVATNQQQALHQIIDSYGLEVDVTAL